MKNQKGFTLIELVVVIAVLAILAGVAIPKFIDITTQAKAAAEAGDVGAIRAGIAQFMSEKLVTTKTKTFPQAADMDPAGTKIFVGILEPNSSADMFTRWSGSTATTFKYNDTGNEYKYTAADGSFIKQ